MTRARSERLHDFDLHLHLERELSLLVSENGVREAAFFLPKSQIEFAIVGGTAKVTMPEWLAIEKGLL